MIWSNFSDYAGNGISACLCALNSLAAIVVVFSSHGAVTPLASNLTFFYAQYIIIYCVIHGCGILSAEFSRWINIETVLSHQSKSMYHIYLGQTRELCMLSTSPIPCGTMWPEDMRFMAWSVFFSPFKKTFSLRERIKSMVCAVIFPCLLFVVVFPPWRCLSMLSATMVDRLECRHEDCRWQCARSVERTNPDLRFASAI